MQGHAYCRRNCTFDCTVVHARMCSCWQRLVLVMHGYAAHLAQPFMSDEIATATSQAHRKALSHRVRPHPVYPTIQSQRCECLRFC